MEKKTKNKKKEENTDVMICPCIICFLYRKIIRRFTHYATADSRRISFIYKKLYRAVRRRITTNVFGCITEKNGRLFCCIATHFRGCNGIGDLLTRQARNFIYRLCKLIQSAKCFFFFLQRCVVVYSSSCR